MILIYERLKEKNTNCLIFLDEPDLGIHPNWQKEYIKELINIFSNFGKKAPFYYNFTFSIHPFRPS
ncbi:MAG: hypothetical protein R2837_11255 [Aliarcobacter sp.]